MSSTRFNDLSAKQYYQCSKNMKMSGKQKDHRDFINSLRSRLNVDDQTIANLELRMAGKCSFDASTLVSKF